MDQFIKASSITQIQYILIAKDTELKSLILQSESLNHEVFTFLKLCPSDVLQINNALPYFQTCMTSQFHQGTSLMFVSDSKFANLQDFFDSHIMIQLFFLDSKSNFHQEIFTKLKEPEKITRYFYFYNSKTKKTNETCKVISPFDFIQKITSKLEVLSEILNIDLVTQLSKNYTVNLENEFNLFVPSHNNYHLINRIVGNFNSKKEIYFFDEKKFEKESRSALESPTTFHRQKILLQQIKEIDHLHYSIAMNHPSLIIILSFHNPDLRYIYEKEVMDLIEGEQTVNYTGQLNTKLEDDIIKQGLILQKTKTDYLDDIAFMHSSFSYSPILRLPKKGKSIYKELSFFKPGTFSDTKIKARINLKNTILNFGKKLKESTLSEELAEYIKNREGQLVFISDLPIEWLTIDNIPLAFSHDVCRIPEMPLEGIASLYNINNQIQYTIPETIMQKTLVIFGSSDKDFLVFRQLVVERSKELGFHYSICESVNDVKESIKRIQPDFLIFDCHGGYDQSSHSSFLLIGNERLDSSFVVDNFRGIPLIFLSACNTAPTYGTHNPIANAFFQTGSLSVTSTYLPISIQGGSILYLRLLNQLHKAAQIGIHKNWLSFISHILRTSAINEAYQKGRKIAANEELLFKDNVDSLITSMIPKKRRDLYHNLDNKLKRNLKANKDLFKNVIPEYLIYTNLGRSDLIIFEKAKGN